MRPFVLLLCLASALSAAEPKGLRVGAAAVEIKGDDSMIIGGGILSRYVKGQEGQLRASALVLHGATAAEKLAIVACDVLMLERDILDAASGEIARLTGIPASHVLINATHTHSAPSTCTLHGYPRDEAFARACQASIVKAVVQANERASASGPATLNFRLGEESSVGQNSRMLMDDGMIFWVGKRDGAVRPTGPFDPELPVLAFRRQDQSLAALLFNHSTHTIGTVAGAVRSPSFYGLAAQDLEKEFGGTAIFIEGASGSTHNLTLKADECVTRIKQAVRDALARAQPMPVTRLVAIKREIAVKARTFDEAREDEAVRRYCTKYIPQPEPTIEVFRAMRKQLAARQGETRKTWVQAMVIGEVAMVGVPAELFTVLGQDIKRRSPYRYTIVAELANDWIGYTPNEAAYDLGGYQVWTGYHSWVERGTGEKLAQTAVDLLNELHDSKP